MSRVRVLRRVGVAAMLAISAGGCQDEALTRGASLDPAVLLAAPVDSGFARATEVRAFTFPADHGPHVEFKSEWWYVTANLMSPMGDEFGVHFTVFRSALAPPGDGMTDASPWASNQVFMAHFAVTDVARARHASFERFGRGAVGIAGAELDPSFRVWLDDWTLAAHGGPTVGREDIFPLVLRAADSSVSVDLVLEAGRPVVLQGDRGLSPKGKERGQASYYFSLPHMNATGTLRSGAVAYDVSGVAWMDREWSTSVLSDDQQGWDWFALHLPDGRDLMLFELRSTVGEPLLDGTLSDPVGNAHRLAAEDVALSTLAHWESPVDGARYPGGWRVRLPRYDVDVEITPLLADQEFRHTFRYWEGAVRVVDGSGSGGRGYVELTGYAGLGIQR